MRPSLILPFAGVYPEFGGEPVFAGPRSAVLGRASLGAGASLGEDSVVRADGEAIRIGANVHLGHRATVHIVHERTPALVGDDVTIGAFAVVHACTVGNACLIEPGATLLDDCVIEDDVLVEAGATVFPRARLERGHVYAGSPARPVRTLEPGELAKQSEPLRAGRGSERALGSNGPAFGDTVFIAQTAQRAGRLVCAPGSSLFFSVVADAGVGSIYVGANTNVQDNTIISAGSGETIIGRETTIGHNVRIGSAVRVGDASLVGIGAVVARGTWVQDDVLLAAGARTEPDQVLESGWMWGGRPARAITRLDDARRHMMRSNIKHYLDYAQAFRRLQAARAATA